MCLSCIYVKKIERSWKKHCKTFLVLNDNMWSKLSKKSLGFFSTPPKLVRMTLTLPITDLCAADYNQSTIHRVELVCCMHHCRFMWSFLLRCCSATFGLVMKINNKNDQESTICNVCDGEIHRRVWGWVDSLLPDCRLINYGAENNSWIKLIWWMALSAGRGSWGYALWHCYCNYISWPWRRFRDVASSLWCWYTRADWYPLKRLL